MKIDSNYRQKIEAKSLQYFDLKSDMLNRKQCRTGVLSLSRIMDRYFGKGKTGFFLEPNLGMRAIINELNEPYEICSPEIINNYEFILISLTSVMDIENLIYTFEKYVPQKVTAQVIVGGFGCLNVKLIKKYIDVAVFGRAEGQINEIIAGFSFKNIWRKSIDPDFEKEYVVRQPVYLVKGESSVGCRNKCLYCQYAYIRHSIGKATKYDPGMKTQETDWFGLVVEKAGKYITAWDGWSEETRKRVNKPIRDKDIKNKLIQIGNSGIVKTVSLKIFQIVGYPWETQESVSHDIEKLRRLLKKVDNQISTKIVLSFLVTPFGPEPLTPMQYEPGNIDINWNGLLAGKKIYYGKKLKAFIITSLMGPFSLMKRMMINRAEIGDIEAFKKIVFSSRLKRLPERHKVSWLIKHGWIIPDRFGQIKSSGFDFLKVGGVV